MFANPIRTDVIHRGPKYGLEQRHYELDDGQVHVLDAVIHPGAAVILPVLPDGRILLERVRRRVVGQDLLELPAGTLEPGEPPIECAARELTEETGYVAQNLQPLAAFYASPGICTEHMHLFVATGLTAGVHDREAGEEIELEPMRLEDALAAIDSGQIVDGKTMTGLLLYDRQQRRQTQRED